MEKCQVCQYYDRQNAKPNDGKVTQWGQCRRGSPMLHPINAKSYMIEGVWPHVRDDDWCGEWKLGTRRMDSRITEVSTGPHVSGASPTSPAPMTPAMPPRPAALSSSSLGSSSLGSSSLGSPASFAKSGAGVGSFPSMLPLPGLAMAASGGRGGD